MLILANVCAVVEEANDVTISMRRCNMLGYFSGSVDGAFGFYTFELCLWRGSDRSRWSEKRPFQYLSMTHNGKRVAYFEVEYSVPWDTYPKSRNAQLALQALVDYLVKHRL